MTIPSGRQAAGAMGVELARRAEAQGFGWCRLLTHWRNPNDRCRDVPRDALDAKAGSLISTGGI